MKKLNLLAALTCAALSQATFAQDYVAVQVEAENYTSKNSLWRVFSNSSTPNINPDPDPSHHSSASGRSYLELLPDTRVTHSDPLQTGTNFWASGGQGPAINYTVNFPESGTYTVWVKAYSTGTEDNGIHVGINGTNPASGERIQWCSGKNNWTWSSAQRASNNHCGVARTITLNIPFAGANTITFTAREDGFEFDQFMLIKENKSGLVCAPTGNNSVSCNQNATGNTTNNQTTTPDPTPDPTPTPDPVATPDPAPVTAPTPVATTQHGACSSDASDPDGDGYGWENGMTCLASGSSNNTGSNSSGSSSGTSNGTPVCVSLLSDEDGDGWGWENNSTCVIDGSSAMQAADTTDSSTPTCASASSDSDGDGWGWENNRSCIAQ